MDVLIIILISAALGVLGKEVYDRVTEDKYGNPAPRGGSDKDSKNSNPKAK